MGVLSGLESLHEANLVHGAVHPNNVLIDSSGCGVLAEYDFTKSPVSDSITANLNFFY
jgi:serine/threonine protein kinase